jgi:DNA-binding CsgD family transcriptional regulator
MLEVLAHLCAGRTNRQVAEALGLGEGTVARYRIEIRRRTGARTRAALVLDALRRRLTPTVPRRLPELRTPLSKREIEVLRLLSTGNRRPDDVARELGLSVRTVFSHSSNIVRKTGLRGRAELTHSAIRHGYIAPIGKPAAGGPRRVTRYRKRRDFV